MMSTATQDLNKVKTLAKDLGKEAPITLKLPM
jgi:hypothetical protein